MDLKLYEVDEDGDCQTFVAAASPEEARAIAFPPGSPSEAIEVTISEMTQEQAEKITAEEEPAQTLWQMFQGLTNPSYLGWTD